MTNMLLPANVPLTLDGKPLLASLSDFATFDLWTGANVNPDHPGAFALGALFPCGASDTLSWLLCILHSLYMAYCIGATAAQIWQRSLSWLIQRDAAGQRHGFQ